jgi:hypothetical protein
MSGPKFVVNNFSSNPVLQSERAEMWINNGVTTQRVRGGVLTDGTLTYPIGDATVIHHRDGRLEDEPPAGEGEKECVLCFERAIKTTLLECGHQTHCVTCARASIQPGLSACPVCRAVVTRVIRFYTSV